MRLLGYRIKYSHIVPAMAVVIKSLPVSTLRLEVILFVTSFFAG